MEFRTRKELLEHNIEVFEDTLELCKQDEPEASIKTSTTNNN